MTKTFQVRRVNTNTGAAIADVCTNERDARAHIFWCALDNIGMSKQAARREANAATIGEPYALDGYLFTIEGI